MTTEATYLTFTALIILTNFATAWWTERKTREAMKEAGTRSDERSELAMKAALDLSTEYKDLIRGITSERSDVLDVAKWLAELTIKVHASKGNITPRPPTPLSAGEEDTDEFSDNRPVPAGHIPNGLAGE